METVRVRAAIFSCFKIVPHSLLVLFENMPFLVHIEMLSKITEYVWVELLCFTYTLFKSLYLQKHGGKPSSYLVEP